MLYYCMSAFESNMCLPKIGGFAAKSLGLETWTITIACHAVWFLHVPTLISCVHCRWPVQMMENLRGICSGKPNNKWKAILHKITTQCNLHNPFLLILNTPIRDTFTFIVRINDTLFMCVYIYRWYMDVNIKIIWMLYEFQLYLILHGKTNPFLRVAILFGASGVLFPAAWRHHLPKGSRVLWPLEELLGSGSQPF